MSDISGFNTRVTINASVTFPVGFVVSQFSNDADPLDFASVKIGDVAMGVNGDLITWSKAVPLPMVLNVIPGSDDDVNLSILAESNRVGQNKTGSADVITAVIVYPDGSVITLTGGKITDASFGKSVSGDGKIKTRTYAFAFQNKTGD